jgi:hypothetical protein
MSDDPVYYQPRRRETREGEVTRSSQFAAVLSRLASDPGYRGQAIAQPELIGRDFKLTLRELKALREVAILSGADVSQVNRIRANEYLMRADELRAIDRLSPVADVDVSCCSCCCCCCGETALAPMSMGR